MLKRNRISLKVLFTSPRRNAKVFFYFEVVEVKEFFFFSLTQFTDLITDIQSAEFYLLQNSLVKILNISTSNIDTIHVHLFSNYTNA